MIGIEQFAERLLKLGADWRQRPLPRKRFDREILMKSFSLTLDSSQEYTEPEINQKIRDWNAEITPAIETDYVTVRRMLIDYGYLERTRDGSFYRLALPASPRAFDLAIEDLDQRATVAAYREAHPRRKQRPQG